VPKTLENPAGSKRRSHNFFVQHFSRKKYSRNFPTFDCVCKIFYKIL